MTRRKKSDELDAALRADPDYQDLCRLLDKQTQSEKERFERFVMAINDLDTRIIELKEQKGLSFPQIADRLYSEGYRPEGGGQFKQATLSERYESAKKRAASQPLQASQSLPSPEVNESREPSQAQISPELIATMRELIREEIKATTAPDSNLDPPPIPRKPKSKEYEGDRKTLPGCRVDEVLFDLFEADRKKAGSASLVMQKILWTYYGRPKLSFEVSEESDS